MVRITHTEVIVLADPEPPHPVDESWIAEMAIVRIYTDEGVTGISEVFSVPSSVAKAVLDGPESVFGRLLVGAEFVVPEQMQSRIWNSMLHGNRHGWAMICMGAVDVALWDIYGKLMGQPVHQLLGGIEWAEHQIAAGTTPGEVVPYGTIVSSDYECSTIFREQIDRVERLCDLGYRAIKVEPLKASPETVVETARRAREMMGPDRMLCVDVGYRWSDIGTARWVADRLRDLDVFFFETPFPTTSLDAYAKLSACSSVRIAAGEHTVTRWQFLDLMDRGGVTVVQPYMTTCGGLTEAKRILELAQPRGVLVCPGNWSTHLLGAATAHFAATSVSTPIVESVPSDLYWSPLRKEIEAIGLPLVDGVIHPSTTPGIGVDLPGDVIRHFQVA